MYLKGLLEKERSVVKGPESGKRTWQPLSLRNKQRAAKRGLEHPPESYHEGPRGPYWTVASRGW